MTELRIEYNATKIGGQFSHQHVRNAFIQAWQRAVDRYLEDGLHTEDEEGRLLRFKEHFTLDQRELDGSGALMRVVKAGVLRDLMNGKVPQRVDLTGGLQPTVVIVRAEFPASVTTQRLQGFKAPGPVHG